jgi:hypothetical protein
MPGIHTVRIELRTDLRNRLDCISFSELSESGVSERSRTWSEIKALYR